MTRYIDHINTFCSFCNRVKTFIFQSGDEHKHRYTCGGCNKTTIDVHFGEPAYVWKGGRK